MYELVNFTVKGIISWYSRILNTKSGNKLKEEWPKLIEEFDIQDVNSINMDLLKQIEKKEVVEKEFLNTKNNISEFEICLYFITDFHYIKNSVITCELQKHGFTFHEDRTAYLSFVSLHRTKKLKEDDQRNLLESYISFQRQKNLEVCKKDINIILEKLYKFNSKAKKTVNTVTAIIDRRENKIFHMIEYCITIDFLYSIYRRYEEIISNIENIQVDMEGGDIGDYRKRMLYSKNSLFYNSVFNLVIWEIMTYAFSDKQNPSESIMPYIDELDGGKLYYHLFSTRFKRIILSKINNNSYELLLSEKMKQMVFIESKLDFYEFLAKQESVENLFGNIPLKQMIDFIISEVVRR